jgi:acyl phosphate:glycerol-3-phosphate acyltransferase
MLLIILSLFLIGSLNGANLLTYLLNLESISEKGSKNPGATNMARIYGKKLGFIVFLFDFLKSFIPLYYLKMTMISPMGLSLGLLLVVFGHCYSIFLRFQGGKGVATFLGGLLAVYPNFFIIGGVVWICIFILSRRAWLSSIGLASSILSLALSTDILTNQYMIPSILISVLIIYRHKNNWLTC